MNPGGQYLRYPPYSCVGEVAALTRRTHSEEINLADRFRYDGVIHLVLEMGRYTIPEILSVPKFHTGTYQYMSYRDSFPGRGERIFLLASVSRPDLGPIHPPV
jgi:hypothetical protein